MIAVADADEHARSRAAQSIWRKAGVLERLPRHFEQQTLLRIHRQRLARRDPEEWRIEPVDAVEESAVAHRHPAGSVRIRIEVRIDVPAVARHIANRITAFAEERPELRRIVGPAGKAAAHANDGDWRLRHVLGGLDLLVQLKRQQRESLRRQLADSFEEVAAHRAFNPSRRAVSNRSTSSSDRSSIAPTRLIGSSRSAVSTAGATSSSRTAVMR